MQDESCIKENSAIRERLAGSFPLKEDEEEEEMEDKARIP